MSSNTPIPEQDARIIERVVQHLVSTWTDFDVDEATSLVAAAVEALRASDGKRHFRPLMVDAMRASTAAHDADQVLDAIVDWVEVEHWGYGVRLDS